MTETTQTHSTPQGGTRARSPEYRLAADALRGLRQELFTDAFAYDPLPRMRVDGPVTRRLPGRLRDWAAWTPHAVVAFAGLLVAIIAASASAADGSGGLGWLTALMALFPVLLVLLRPTGAFWISMAATPFIAVLGNSYDDWPWPTGSFASHLVVLTVAAVRTGPRTAAWMWIMSGVYGIGSESILGAGHYSSNTGPMLVVSALLLLVVAVWHVRRTAEKEVTAQQTVTEHERSRRTLLEERTTIARELHDVVAHHMSVVAIQAEAAPYRVENPPPELERAFATIRENAVAALTELRRVLGVVRAEDYEAPDAPQPTLADLDALLANVRDTGLSVDKTVTGAVRELPQGVELSAYRIVQEALSNSLRHAPGA